MLPRAETRLSLALVRDATSVGGIATSSTRPASWLRMRSTPTWRSKSRVGRARRRPVGWPPKRSAAPEDG